MHHFLLLPLLLGILSPFSAVLGEEDQEKNKQTIAAVKIFKVPKGNSKSSYSSNYNPEIQVLTNRGTLQRYVVEKWNFSKTKNYVDQGAICKDKEDGDISQMVEVSGDVVNLTKPGTYVIRYNCNDSEGSKAKERIRTVIVTKPQLL